MIVVEGKLESSGAVSETIFRAGAETTLQLDASDAANALFIMDGANTDTINLPGHYTINAAESQSRGGKVAYDPPMSAAGEQASAQSTSAENGFIVSNPFPFTETASGNKDHSAFQFKPSMDHHAVTDPEINDITKEHPEHPAHPHSAVNQLASFKFADEGSADSGHLAHPHFDNAKVPGTVMSDAASDQFAFEKGHDKVADVKPDVIETDPAVADIRHLLHTAHDANAVGALDPNHTTAPQDMTKVQLPHHHGDFHFA